MNEKYKDKNWLYNEYINKNRTLKEIALECGVSIVAIHNWKEKFQIPKAIRKGEKSCKWKGGICIRKDGFRWIYKPNHPRANVGYVPEHVLVMEKEIERFIKKDELVHHLNGNKLDNSLQNLFLCKSRSEHIKIHTSLRNLIYYFYQENIIKFDKEKKAYYF